MQRWILVMADALRLLVIPGLGAWGMVHTRPLTLLPAAAYLVMMGLLPATIFDLRQVIKPAEPERPEQQRELPK